MRASVSAIVEWAWSLYGEPPAGTCVATYAARLDMILEPLDDDQIARARRRIEATFIPTPSARWPRPERFVEAFVFGLTEEV